MNTEKRLFESLDAFVRQIAQISTSIPRNGLISGKTGIAILLYEYARYKNDSKIEEAANRLIDRIVQETGLDSGMSLDFGLCGIAWGISYLKKEMFIQEYDGVLEEIDIVLFKEKSRLLNLYDFKNETDIALYAWFRFLSCQPASKNRWLQRIANCVNNLHDILLQRYTSHIFPVFPCRYLTRFFQLSKTLCSHGMYCREINSLFEELPEFVKLSLEKEKSLSDKYMLISMLADIPTFDKCIKDDNAPLQTMTWTDVNNYYITRLLLGKTVIISGLAEQFIQSVVEDGRKTDELLHQLNPENARIGSGIGGLAWSILQWSIENYPQPVCEKQLLMPNKNRHVEMRKCQMLELIPKLDPLACTNAPRYIVSLTSYGKRLTDTAPFAIISLLNQKVKPDKVVLWIAWDDKENIPQVMNELTSKGLEIHFCDDIKSYQKLVFTLDVYPDDYIITADDDIYYPQNWFERLLDEHKKHPKKIICHRAHGIKVDEKHYPLPYASWDKSIDPVKYFEMISDERHVHESIFPTGVSGILYPPKCLHGDVANKELFMELAPKADDIWFWAMAVINRDYFNGESPYIVIENGYSTHLHVIDPEQEQGDNALWNYNSKGGNDRQLKAVIEHYQQIIKYLQSIDPTKTATQKMEDFSSKQYWEERYAKGGNSGAGSYNLLAQFKAEILNDFVNRNAINSIMEFGCGDGNQLLLAQYPVYVGFDVSETAIKICQNKFIRDNTKQFRLTGNYNNENAELTLSLDVIYHLIEEDVFTNYMKMLFHASTRFVIIYSSNQSAIQRSKHVKHRKFTDWIDTCAKDWELVQFVPNRYPVTVNDDPTTSFSDFYIFRKKVTTLVLSISPNHTGEVKLNEREN